MWILGALGVAVLGTLSSRFRHFVGGFIYWPSVVVALLVLYGMTLP